MAAKKPVRKVNVKDLAPRSGASAQVTGGKKKSK
jgi:hypothetical protein